MKNEDISSKLGSSSAVSPAFELLSNCCKQYPLVLSVHEVYCMWAWHIPMSETCTLCVHGTLCLLHVDVAHSNVRNPYVVCTQYVMLTACGRGTFQRPKPIRCVYTVRYVYCMWAWHIPTSETCMFCVHGTLCLLHVDVVHSNV